MPPLPSEANVALRRYPLIESSLPVTGQRVSIVPLDCGVGLPGCRVEKLMVVVLGVEELGAAGIVPEPWRSLGRSLLWDRLELYGILSFVGVLCRWIWLGGSIGRCIMDVSGFVLWGAWFLGVRRFFYCFVSWFVVAMFARGGV